MLNQGLKKRFDGILILIPCEPPSKHLQKTHTTDQLLEKH